jgi:hypothetical protein
VRKIVGEAARAATKAENSRPLEWLARLGLVSRGVIWLVVGVLALRIATGDNTRADRNGALQAIADKPLGKPLLVVLVVGFLGYGCWRLLEAAVGHRDADEGRDRLLKRLVSLARGVLYLGFAYSTVRFLTTGSSNDKTKPLTARLMSHTGGRPLVFIVGAAIVIGGLTIAVRAFKQKFADKLDCAKMPDWLERATKVIGTAGLTSRGAVFTMIGAFLIDAAVTFDPNKAKGLDATLKTVAAEAYGRGLLMLAGLGLVAFSLWSFLEARYRKI